MRPGAESDLEGSLGVRVGLGPDYIPQFCQDDLGPHTHSTLRVQQDYA